jgi:hypothetical protein
MLGVVERLVRLIDQFLGGRGGQRGATYPKADGYQHIGELAAGDGLSQLFSQLRRAGQIGRGEEDAEFLAAITADNVRRPHAGSKRLGDAAQHVVSAGMAVGVVDGLEMVNVEHDGAERLVVAFGPGEGGGELLVKRAAVEAASKAVTGGQALQLLVLLLHPLLGLSQLLDHLDELLVLLLDLRDIVEGEDAAADAFVRAENAAGIHHQRTRPGPGLQLHHGSPAVDLAGHVFPGHPCRLLGFIIGF